jgi:peroxiredoxin
MAPRLPTGSKAPEFEATTVSGMRYSLADLTGSRSAVAFFSVSCTPCHTQLPEFVAYARTIPGGASQVIAVVSGDGEHEREAAAHFTDELAAVASVVVEPRQGPLATAFSVQGFPTFYALDESGRIEAGGVAVRMISAPRQLA